MEKLEFRREKMVHIGRGMLCLNLEEQWCGPSLVSKNARQ